MSKQDRIGPFFLKRRGKRGLYYVCWYDAARRQTRGFATRTDDPDVARRQLQAHAQRAGRASARQPGIVECREGHEISRDDVLLAPEQILYLATRAPRSGIYFLIQGTVVVYVGQSTRARDRVQQHAREGLIQFDRCLILPCFPGDLRAVESAYIDKLRPKFNQVRVSRVAASLCENLSGVTC